MDVKRSSSGWTKEAAEGTLRELRDSANRPKYKKILANNPEALKVHEQAVAVLEAALAEFM
jgi:hypothetical protein